MAIKKKEKRKKGTKNTKHIITKKIFLNIKSYLIMY